MQVTGDDLVVARVLNEDENFMILEILKNDFKEVLVAEGDQYYILAFVTNVDNDNKQITIGKPWE